MKSNKNDFENSRKFKISIKASAFSQNKSRPTTSYLKENYYGNGKKEGVSSHYNNCLNEKSLKTDEKNYLISAHSKNLRKKINYLLAIKEPAFVVSNFDCLKVSNSEKQVKNIYKKLEGLQVSLGNFKSDFRQNRLLKTGYKNN